MSNGWSVLVVDDEPVMRESLAAWLLEDGYHAEVAASGTEAVEMMRARAHDVCLVDLKMPGGPDGIETLRMIRALRPETIQVILTAYATIDTAVQAMREGAQDYLPKPCNPEQISLLLERLLKVKALERENRILRGRLDRRERAQEPVVTRNPKMLEILDLLRRVADQKSTVLIRGESGTGKDLLARTLHNMGQRSAGPFVGVSCAALAETLLESELFGHERGAFTGATARRKGKFELANGGTLLLDEIGDISPKLQFDLLRVLQERRFFRVGGSVETEVDVRVVAATSRDLEAAVRAGRFREALFFRLNVIGVELPPLRERREDIPLLVEHFLQKFSGELGLCGSGATEGALRLLSAHDWPGNVRELENAVERAVVTCNRGELTEKDFEFMNVQAPVSSWSAPNDRPLHEVERRVIEATLAKAGGNVKRAAQVLGIDRSTLYMKLKRYREDEESGGGKSSPS